MNSDIMQRYMSQAMKMYKAHLQAENRSDIAPVFEEVKNVPEMPPEEANQESEPMPVPEANENEPPAPVSEPMGIPEIELPVNVDEQLNEEKSYGTLTVNVSSTRGLFSVAGAAVSVFYGPYENYRLVGEAQTDESGKAVFRLETPSAELSETPDSAQKPYATYSVVIDAPGYLRHINLGVPVFAGINSVQDVVLTSTSAANGTEDIVVPNESDYDL